MSLKEFNSDPVSIEAFIDGLDGLGDSVFEESKKLWYQVGAAHLARTVKNTPVGHYSNEVDFYTRDGQHVHFFTRNTPIGGQLRLRWQQTPIEVDQNKIITTVFNNTDYAPYVEFGHRIRNKDGETIGWVPGRFMMTNSIKITEEQDIPQVLDEIMRKVLGV